MLTKDKKGVLIVISAFGGAGKGTIIKELIKDEHTILSVSATSRVPRPDDEEGVTYFFKTREEFENMIRGNELLEWVEFCGNYYGTPRSYIEDKLLANENVILELEEVGAIKVKEMYKDAVLIFILPPNMNELISRLKKRGENDEYISKRLKKSIDEAELIKHYEYVVVNDILEDTVEDIKKIIYVAKSKVAKNQKLIDDIKEELKNVTTII
ncbi:MAG: guanylate kinase [Clostridiales bacterium GWD2_32_59]|nr:MAG: guanylate kinase [Clostridiales bacterium GWD2_32_59]